MDTNIMLKLIEAGYTKEDIVRLEETETKPTQSPDQVPEAPAEPEQTEEPSERMNETITEIMQIIGKMQNTLDAMQKKNANEAESAPSERMTADKVIKDFFAEKKKA